VDQVREQRDAAGEQEDQQLAERRQAQHAERQRHSAQALARAFDAVVHQTVRVPVALVCSGLV